MTRSLKLSKMSYRFVILLLMYSCNSHTVCAQVCPYGWVDRPNSDSCYLVTSTETRYKWREASARCEAHDAELFSINDEEEKKFLISKLRQLSKVHQDVTDWWTGLVNRADGKQWVWSDGTMVNMSIIPWKGQTPNAASDKMQCTTINMLQFQITNCINWKRILCERSKSLPLKCDDNRQWEAVNGSCYKGFSTRRTFTDASLMCEQHNAQLPTIGNWETQVYLWDKTREIGGDIWTGLYSEPEGNKVAWKWISGDDFSGQTWWAKNYPGNVLSQANNTCVQISQAARTRRLLSWHTTVCDSLIAYVCQKPQGVCSDGWLQHQSMCYQFNPKYSLSWPLAKQYCESQGGELGRIMSPSHQAFINEYLSQQAEIGFNRLWIGISDNGNDAGPFTWGNMTSLGDYINWATGNPVNTPGSQDCAFIDTRDTAGKWQTTKDCTQVYSFICSIPVNSPVKKTVTPAPHFNCNPGWDVFSEKCYLFNDTDLSWVYARAACQEEGADLAVILNSETQAFFNGRIHGGDYWIGLNDRTKEGTFTWLDNLEKATYTHWNNKEPNNINSENCVSILGKWGANQNGKWNDYQCDREFRYICEKNAINSGVTQLTPTTPVTWSKQCGAFWEDSPHSDYCYQFNTKMLTYMDARDECRHHGGHLASITSLQEQYYISGRLRGVSVTAMWIGGNDRSQEAGWKWEDGSPFAFFNWAPGEPNDYRKDEDCASILVKNSYWNDFNCVRRNGFICKKLGTVTKTTVSPSASPMTVPAGWSYGCDGGWKSYQNSCFLVVRKAITWSEARSECRANGGDLASLYNKEENNFIMSQITKQTCTNLHSSSQQCKTWANSGECQKNPIWMSKNCRSSCGLCRMICQDKHTTNECIFWSNIGECKKNPIWMHKNCARSCQICDTGSIDALWLGLNDIRMQMNFKWTDGTKVVYTNWAVSEPNNYGGKHEDCVLMYSYNGQWNDHVCDTKMRGYVCRRHKRFLSTTAPPAYSIGCPKGSFGYQSWCYTFHTSPLPWSNAENVCKGKQGHLATVSNRYIQAFLAAELVDKDDVYWIGLTDTATPGHYYWSSNASLTYTPWGRTHNGSERNTCVAMTTLIPVGLWQNVNCDTRKPYICEVWREGFTTPTPTTSPPTTAYVSCPDYWHAHNDYCYRGDLRTSGSSKSWMEAREYCRGLGGDLASIHDEATNVFILNSVLRYAYTGNFWIGLNDLDTETSYKWSDGSAFAYANWFPGEPNDHGQNEDCVELNKMTRRWNDNNCVISRSFICQLRRGMTIPTTTVKPTTPAIQCADKDWTFHGGYCYYISKPYGTGVKRTWFDARRFCMNAGGNLLSINNKDEHNYIISLISKSSTVMFWVGLNELGINSYQWSDGSPVNYYAWSKNEPNDAYGGQKCVNIYHDSGLWNDDNCMDTNGFICKKLNISSTPKVPTSTPVINGGCPYGFSQSVGNKCYYIGGLNASTSLSWEGARNACRALSGGNNSEIATISSIREQAFLITIVKNFTTALWIGLNSLNTAYRHGYFVWQDNSEVAFTNWDKGEPSNIYGYPRSKCVEMYTREDKAGLWNNEDCSQTLGYVCQTFKDSSLPTVAPTSSNCKSGYSSYGTSCYKWFGHGKNWLDAEMTCRNDSGNLVSITNIYEQSYVDLILYQSTSATWIGLSDSKRQGTYVWSDGWPVSYSRWGPPNDPQGKQCVSIHDFKWFYDTCSLVEGFICEINSEPPPPTTPVPPGFCPNKKWQAHGDYCYMAFPSDSKSWPEARYMCQHIGMHLVSIHDQKELDFVLDLVKQTTTTPRYGFYQQTPNVWMGLTKALRAGFEWVDGSPTNFLKWAKGEPSDSSSTNSQHEECVEMYRATGLWNDLDCLQNRGYVCKTMKTFTSTSTASTTTPMMTSTTQLTQAVTTHPAITIASKKPDSPFIPATWRPPFTTPHQPVTTWRQPFTPWHQPYTPQSLGSDELTIGQLAGIIIGAIGFLVIVCVVAFILKRRNKTGEMSTAGGFDNALFSKDGDSVTMTNGNQIMYMADKLSDDEDDDKGEC